MKYYIADVHFFGQGCLRTDQDNRPFTNINEMNQKLKENWNETVCNSDYVYILGDLCMPKSSKRAEEILELVSTLRGKKILVAGNHDDLRDYRYQQLFHEIAYYKEVTDNSDGNNHNLILSHYPMYAWKNQHKGWIHLYGHVHMTREYAGYQKALNDFNQNFMDQDETKALAINVGCMLPYMDYKPKTLKEILDGIGFTYN